MNKVWEIYFSPTGTTKTVVHTLALELAKELNGQPNIKCGCNMSDEKAGDEKGRDEKACDGKDSGRGDCREYGHFAAEIFDFTLPQARQSFPDIGQHDIVVFGMPTYAGRLPNLLIKYLDTIKGNGATTVAVVTFGNRNFDNSLIELRHILDTHGFCTVAAGAFACEHSFSYTLGAGRPNRQDLAEICHFAQSIATKLINGQPNIDSLCSFTVPGCPAEKSFGGYYQPRDRHGVSIDIRKVKPLTNSRCTDCGICLLVCPMGAIAPEDVTQVPGICIKCGACTKKCPEHAKYYIDEGYLYHKSELEAMYSAPATNQIFL